MFHSGRPTIAIAGFTNSGAKNGDKSSALGYVAALAAWSQALSYPIHR